MMNFSIWSLHRYLNQCSYPSIADAEKGIDLPFMHYLVVGITPGNEAIFEKHLQDMSKKAQSNSEPFIWKVWKVIAGADIPKYVILQSAGSEQDLEKQKKQLDFLPSNFKDIIRNQREGNAEYNPQLSLKQ